MSLSGVCTFCNIFLKIISEQTTRKSTVFKEEQSKNRKSKKQKAKSKKQRAKSKEQSAKSKTHKAVSKKQTTQTTQTKYTILFTTQTKIPAQSNDSDISIATDVPSNNIPTSIPTNTTNTKTLLLES